MKAFENTSRFYGGKGQKFGALRQTRFDGKRGTLDSNKYGIFNEYFFTKIKTYLLRLCKLTL